MAVTFRNFFRRPVTVHYPDVTRPYPDRFRGVLALTYDPETGEENCIGCRLCEYICPPQVIKVEMLKAEKRNYAKSFFLSSTPASSASCASRSVRPTPSSC
jgi:NADH-quinone oxidoreductase subunit I